MNVLMIVRSDVAHDSRVLREALTLAEHGYRVTVVGSGVPDEWMSPTGVEVVSLGARSPFSYRPPRGQPLPLYLRGARWLLLPRHNASVNESFRREVRSWASQQMPYDVVHAHDMPMLPVAHELSVRWGAALVYDAHEWWSSRHREQRPTPVADRRGVREERRLACAADLVITVSNGIAERFRGWGVQDVRIVRNTFPIHPSAPDPVRRAEAAIYAGRVDGARDLETVFRAARADPTMRVTLAGPLDWTFMARHLVPKNVALVEAVAPDDVDALLRAAGVALVTLDDSCDNHRLALPNKLYQAVRAGVPVVASDLPEIRRVVTGYGIGEVYTPGDEADLRAALRRVMLSPTAYATGLLRAREELAWSVDSAVLGAAYATIGAMRTRETSG